MTYFPIWRGCDESIQYARDLLPLLIENYADQHIIICIGGDGTLLEAIHNQMNISSNCMFLPINLGTRGYLMNRSMSPKALANYINNDLLQQIEMPTLQIVDQSLWGFNEIAIKSAGGQANKLMVSVDGHQLSNEPVIGDGVIISTGQGSTGYNMACGGSARHPLSQDLGITFINAYSPRVPPIVVPRGSTITIKSIEHNKRPCIIHTDGKQHTTGLETKWTIKEGPEISILYTCDHNFIQRMIGKIVR